MAFMFNFVILCNFYEVIPNNKKNITLKSPLDTPFYSPDILIKITTNHQIAHYTYFLINTTWH